MPRGFPHRLAVGIPAGVASATAQSRRPRRTGSAGGSGDNPLIRAARAVADATWGEGGARTGLAARGVVFVILGYLVMRIASGGLGGSSTSKPASGPGVAEAIAAHPAGRIALAVLAVGLILFAMFSLLDAVLHHNDEDSDAKRWGYRALSSWTCVVYAGFGVYCFTVVFGAQSSGKSASQSDQQQSQWSARVLGWPGGAVWLGLLGAVLGVVAVVMAVQAVRFSFRDRLDEQKMSPRARRATLTLGEVGYLGRAALFALVGWFVLSAAVDDDPQQGQGVDGSVRKLAQSSAGPYVLGVLAVMLALFGLYMFAEARYRKV